jgi:subfamily B ATP-binding cassette protein MsbA
MVSLGFLAALTEGVGLSLFMPFLYSLDPTAFAPTEDGALGNALQRLFERVPAERRLLAVSLGIMAVVLAKNLLVYANEVLRSWTRTLLVHSLRTRLADELLLVQIDHLEARDAGKLQNALQHQTQEVGTAFANHAELLVRASAALVFSAFLLLVSWRLTLAVGIALLAISALIRLAWRRIELDSRRFVGAWDELSQRCLEILSGMRTIRAFDRVDFERERFAKASQHASRVWFGLDLLSGLIRPASEVLVVAVLVGVLLFSLPDAAALPSVLTFAFLLYRLRPHVQGLDLARAQLLAAQAPVATVMQLIDPAGKPRVHSGARPFTALGDAIRFEGVGFRHAGSERDALSNLSLRIPAGRTTALIGRSGSGKSTIVHLLLRLYDPTCGALLVDGVPLADLDLRAWRRRVSVVTQDALLFNASVRENIAYGNPTAGSEQIARAARMAGADEFVRALPEGYDTFVGDQGMRLSGGQKQRIALARALVREPEILILDEATSALDAEAERLVQEAVAALGHGLTLIVVSHRLSAVARADHFVLLEAGAVSAEGDRLALGAWNDTVQRLYGASLPDDLGAEAAPPRAAAAGGP